MEKKTKIENRDKEMSKISKAMCYLLRHQAVQNGLKIESTGFINLDELIMAKPLKKLNVTREMVFEIVQNDNKGRYQLENRPPYFIRAVQGHSIKEVKDEDILECITNIFEYPVVVHGTYLEAWDKIKKTGLNRMSRNCIHFSIGHKKDDHVLSGMRDNCEVYIEVNAIQASYSDIQFFVSKNKVVLTPGMNGVISPNYFKKVFDKTGNVLYAQEIEIGIRLTFDKIDESEVKGAINILDLKSAKNNLIFSEMFSEFNDLNKITPYLIGAGEGIFKKPFTILIDKKIEANYVTLIKRRQDQIKDLAIFVEYITLESLQENKFTAESVKRIDLNFKKHYNKEFKEQDKICDNNLSYSTNLNPKKQNIIKDYKLSKDMIKDKSIEKNYILLFLNFEEEDILTSIDYVLIPNGTLENFKNFTFKLLIKQVRENLKIFLSEFQKNLSESKADDKRLILCCSKEDLSYFNNLMKKNSVKSPNIFQRNVILLNQADFSSLQSDESKFAAEIFLIQYIQNESTIEKIKIQC